MTAKPRQLMDHQSKALEWAKGRDDAALFMEMRLGKTLVIIRWLRLKKDAKKILIVCPLSVVASWRKELALEGEKLVELTGSATKRAKILEENTSARWFAINYEGLTERGHKTYSGKPKATPSGYACLPWDAVIADESTRIRSPRAAITKVFLDHLSDVKYKALLSGLPNPEGPEDFVTQMIWLRGIFMGVTNYWHWRDQNCFAAGHEHIVKAGAIGKVRVEVHDNAFVLSRREAGIGNKKIREQREVIMPQKLHQAIADLKKDFEIADKLTNNVLEILTIQSQVVGGRWKDDVRYWHDAKLKELVALVTGELKQEQVVIWAHYTAELKAISDELTMAKVSHGLVTGKYAPIQNETSVARFQKSASRVLIAQPKCIQMGIDLSTSDTAIYYSNYLDYEIRAQTEDRIEHPKKKSPLLIIDIVAKDTIDEDFVEALGDKREDSKLTLRKFISLAMKRVA